MKDAPQRPPALSPEQRALFSLRLKNKRRGLPHQTAIPRSAGRGAYPLSFQQEQLWFLQQLTPESTVHNLHHTYNLLGPLDPEALARSLDEIVRRHEILRTSFVFKDGEASQRVSPTWAGTLSIVDLRDAPEAEREGRARALADEQAQRPFDLARDKLLRVTLLRLGEERHFLLLTIHHIATDWWSFKILFRELSALYRAYLDEQPSPLNDLPIQYGDFSLWQREWLQGETLKRLLSYWKRRLAGAPHLLSLPTDYPRPRVRTHRGGREHFTLPRALFDSFHNLGRRENVTVFTTLLAAFQTFLYRYTDQETILVGTPSANRPRAETEGLIGFFLNTIVLDASFTDNPTFRELLSRSRRTVMDAQAHQELPFRNLVQELQPERNPGFTPLFQAAFIYLSSQAPAFESLDSGQPALSLPGLRIEEVEETYRTSEFDVSLCLEERADGLFGFLEYSADLFEPATVRRMIGHLRRLLEAIVEAPDRPVSGLPLVSEAELRRVSVGPEETAAASARDRCVHELFEEQVARTPDAVAVVAEGRRLTYVELNARANQLAGRLRALGAAPDTTVGICVARSVELMVGILGILKAGAAYVPLDPSNPRERLSHILADAAPTLLLTQESLLSELPPFKGRLLCLDADWAGEIAQWDTANLANTARADNLVYVIYTSGSTGRPKGTMVTHRGLVNYLTWCVAAYQVARGAGAPVHTSISFDLTITALFAPLLTGRRVELLPDGVGIEPLSEALRREVEFSLIKITPSQLQLLGRRLTPQEAGGRTRAFIIGGENLTAENVLFWREAAPETLLVNEYGPTETVVGCCAYRVPQGENLSGSVPIGVPIANTEVYVLNRFLQPVPAQAPGELYVGGAGVARGYLRRPGLTAEKFVPNAFSKEPGARLYRTGDLARRLPDGNLEFLGRADEQIKIYGRRIEPGEIETALREHPAIHDAIVMVREQAPFDGLLAAYMVADGEAKPSTVELRDYLGEKLPLYMIPAAVVWLDRFPRTAGGKVDRRALSALEMPRQSPSALYIAPQDETEQKIAETWREVLSVEQVGRFDNFFDLGGDSMLVYEMHARLRVSLGAELSVLELFNHPTVAALARHLRQRGHEESTTPQTDERIEKRIRAANRRKQGSVSGTLRGGESP